MNPSDAGKGDQKSFPGCGFPHSSHRLRGSPSEKHSLEEKSVRVKRRRTRRERNSVKFGRNASDQAPEQRGNCWGLQKRLPPFWGSQLRLCAQSTPIRGICGAKPAVIITQNRLTQQHQGMFNREVKSADIERLLSPIAEPQVLMEVTPDNPMEKLEKEQVQPHKPHEAAAHRSVPTEQSGCAGKDLGGGNNEDPLCVIPASVAEPHCGAGVGAAEAESQLLVAPLVLGFSPQDSRAFQSNASPSSMVLNEKENVPPAPPGSGTEAAKGRSLVKELAQDLQRLLDLKAKFAGRNLISETRQAVFRVLREQKRTLPDLSALASLKKLASGCDREAIHADFKSPANRDQEEFCLELKPSKCSSSSSSRNSDLGVSLKKRRGQEEPFLAGFSPSPGYTAVRMAEERPGQGESFEISIEPEGIDQYSFHLTTVHPYPHLHSASSQHMNSPRNSEEQLRTSQPWEQGSAEAFWGPRGRQERAEVATKRALPKKQISRRHCMPFTTHDPLASSSLTMNNSGSDPFLLTEPPQHSCVYELSPDVWWLRGMEPVPVHSLHPSQELRSFQLLDPGLRNTERAPAESQTSFDVLKSIWSPKPPRKGTKLPVPRPLAYPHLARQLPSSGELNLDQGQPEEFLQLYNIIPEQHCASFYRQNPQQDMVIASRPAQHGNDLFSVLANPRIYCQKVSVEQGKPSESYPIWGLAEAPERSQGTREKSSSSRTESQAGDLERLIQLESAWQLQAFQQLPMSYFPPSEALEGSGKTPLCTLQGHLLGQASPEPWAFPRMKLY
ncbi:proline-rich protein 19 [Sceloporus undulatus]|uniref:proline-rich protein 19 n=1 Tax=Sceloporus undulatus TaxID=8520 RepID=UPI001C4C38B7|nr:proline-rich protein 19 [Sceloporus undulatus]